MLDSRLTAGCLMVAATVMVTACNPNQTATTPETPPTNTPESTAPATAATPDRSNALTSGAVDTQGSVGLVNDNGTRKLVFDAAFSTAESPDPVVVLHVSANPLEVTEPPDYPLDPEDYLVIAPLQATTGTQEYVIPADVNLEDFQSVVVWCRQMNSTFGFAPLP